MTLVADVLSITVAEARDQAVVARLMQLYQHDFSEFARGEQAWGDVDENGLFSFIRLDSSWEEERRKPLLFRVKGKLAGFAVIKDWSASGRPVDWSVSEFFVMRKYRRCGFGSQAAGQIISSHPGVWEVPISLYNLPALAFWRSALSGLAGHDLEQLSGDGARWSGPILRLTPGSSMSNRVP